MKPYDDFEKSLLRAGRSQRAPRRLREKTAAAITATLAGSTAAHGAGAATALKVALTGSRVVVAKWLVVGTLGAAAVGGVVVHGRTGGSTVGFAEAPSASTTRVQTAAVASAAPSPGVPSTPTASSPPPPEVAAPAVAAPAEAAPAVTAPAVAAPAVPTAAPAPASRQTSDVASAAERTTGTSEDAPTSEPRPKKSALAEELRLVEGARHRLAAKEPRAALALLDEHARSFPSGNLAIERDALRVDALVAAGESLAAQRAAEHFLLAHPRAAQSDRVRRIATTKP